ncbi:MAG: ATP-dependent DNA helicase PcrA [Chroococcopsis gigantea SAG 12.99]|jgi:DNA helicase-2/ATP-dependent DNA helicase PcrA|nr:DNA helicase PcrA [Chlorogloea purpurea SAG 13.99]MDV2999822.1 ATP-dependent DNA helicase PcrA [Chroococcopsis gigantea SAG 12.99]
MTTNLDYLRQLNPSQRSAVEHFCGPLLVVAGAGSGKTRALTYRIIHLIRYHKVDPENILAVTFTNKAAREMKLRIERTFAGEICQEKHEKPFEALKESEQKSLLSQVYRCVTKKLWIGTFHGLCSRILRYDIGKYRDEKGRTWRSNFSIMDESDVQSLLKNIVTKQFNLDEKKFDARSIRYSISNAKNLGLSPDDYLKEHSYPKGRIIAEVYQEYQNQLCANNAVDFDDLILIPVRLFQQNESVLGYWHNQFKHILVDEYQDTNQIQYDLIRLLGTNGETDRTQWDWRNRSIFVVGDADQSIYSFRMADFTILLNFQKDFGDGLPDADTRTMVKLEENYRSRENILEAANKLIENNTQRIDKVLKATRGSGDTIGFKVTRDEQEEAEFVVSKIKEIKRNNPELNWGSFAILYRINSQSRPFEDVLIKSTIPYTIVGGFKFYDRQEIKDAVAYLRVIANPADTVSLLRVINTPRRGIGKTTIENLLKASQELSIPLWEIISDETSVNTIAGRAAKSLNEFSKLLQDLHGKIEELSASEILTEVMESSGYIEELRLQGTEEADNRLENIFELSNAVLQYQEDNEDITLQGFLSSASLASDLDNLKEGEERVSLMTLHSAKGLEFPIVYLVGLEQGLLPHSRSLNDPLSLEEERRLCYVGVTRAQEQLFLTYAKERYVWGNRETKIPSQFLEELPQELLDTGRGKQTTKRSTGSKIVAVKSKSAPNDSKEWEVGDRVLHPTFGEGKITNVFEGGRRISIAVKFDALGNKILDPVIAKLQKLN